MRMETVGQRRWLRIGLLAAAGILLLTALWGGLLRLGWAWPVLRPTLPALHGPLMVCGFLGTLIGLERAVGTGKRWAYAGPALTAAGALLALAGVPAPLPALLVTLGSAVVFAVLVTLVRTVPALFTVVIAGGGLAWLVGNLLWLAGRPIPVAVVWWIGFLVLTVAGERLELSRYAEALADQPGGVWRCGSRLRGRDARERGCLHARRADRRGRPGAAGRLAPGLRHGAPPDQGRRPGALHCRDAALGLRMACGRRHVGGELCRRHGRATVRCYAARHLSRLRDDHNLSPTHPSSFRRCSRCGWSTARASMARWRCWM